MTPSEDVRLEALARSAMRAAPDGVIDIRGVMRAIIAGCAARAGLPHERVDNPLFDEARSCDLSPEDLGRVYERLLAGLGGRKRSGSYFTTSNLTPSVVGEALSALEVPSHGIRACDPAMGAGAFLLALGRELEARLGAGVGTRRKIALECLRGVDLDPVTVDVARAAVWLWVADPNLPLGEVSLSLHTGDALLGVDWSSFAGGGFDLVIGNPPWVAFAGRATQPIGTETRADYRRRYAAFRGYPTLHGMFVELATRLAPRGTIALLLPSPIADLDGYRPTRRALTETHTPREPLTELGQDAFEGVVQPSFVLIATPSTSPGASDAPWRLNERQRYDAAADTVKAPAILELFARGAPLPPTVFRELGLQSSGRVAKELFLRADSPEGDFSYPLLEGRDVAEFRQGSPRLFLARRDDVLRESKCRVRERDAYEGVDFVVRQTASHPIAALHRGWPFRNTLLAGFSTGDLSAPLLVGLLNSALYRALHLAATRDARQAVFPQVKLSHLRRLPLPPADAIARARIADVATRATEAGVDRALRDMLDDAVFNLFGVPGDHRNAIFSMLRERAPKLGYEAPAKAATSSLEGVAHRLGLPRERVGAALG